MSVKVELQMNEQNWKSQAETYLDTTISCLAKRKKQLEDDLAYVQEELQKCKAQKGADGEDAPGPAVSSAWAGWLIESGLSVPCSWAEHVSAKLIVDQHCYRNDKYEKVTVEMALSNFASLASIMDPRPDWMAAYPVWLEASCRFVQFWFFSIYLSKWTTNAMPKMMLSNRLTANGFLTWLCGAHLDGRKKILKNAVFTLGTGDSHWPSWSASSFSRSSRYSWHLSSQLYVLE